MQPSKIYGKDLRSNMLNFSYKLSNFIETSVMLGNIAWTPRKLMSIYIHTHHLWDVQALLHKIQF